VLLTGAILFPSCNKISDPYYSVKAVVVDTTWRPVLLEDYTGHLCVNCAPAATLAATLQELYPAQVYVVSVHAGQFALPIPSNPDFTGDYRCTASNDWFGYTGFNIDGNPKGMVNRVPFNNKISFGTSDWNEAVKKVKSTYSRMAVMTVHNVYNAAGSMLNSRIDVKFLQGYAGKVNLTVCILEDSIIGGQKNIIPPDSVPLIRHYNFMHVLRGTLTGSFGDLIVTAPANGDLITRSFPYDFNKSPSWVPEHCSVIAFISDADTKEVLHVAKSEHL
jgi:hypothetical protein